MTGETSDDNALAPALGQRLKTFATAQLQTARAHLARQGEARHAGIHEARKCLRRARATLALGARVLGSAAAAVDRDLQRLCRELSVLRDGQALIEALRRLDDGAQASSAATLSAVEAATLRRDEALAKALARDVDFQARRRRLECAQANLARLDWTLLDHAGVHEAMSRTERRMRKADRQTQKRRHDDQAWHTFRRRLRRVRQQGALLTELEPALAGSIKDLDLQANALGVSQDDALLLARCGRRSRFPPEVRGELRRIARQRLKHARDPG